MRYSKSKIIKPRFKHEVSHSKCTFIAIFVNFDSQQKDWHEMASEIYQMFVTHPTSLVRLKLTRGLIKGMEAFMVGDTVGVQ